MEHSISDSNLNSTDDLLVRSTNSFDLIEFDKKIERGNIYTRLVKGTGISPSYILQKEIIEGENYLDELPELNFEVIKEFRLFTSRRTLKLSKHGIENYRPDSTKPSSVHTYLQIVDVIVRDKNTLVISYDGEHNYVYKSDVAVQICQEITSRMILVKNIEKKKKKFSIMLQYKEAEKAYLENTLIEFSEPSHERVRSNSIQRDKALKLTKLLGTTEQERIDSEIVNILLDLSQPEGISVSNFLKRTIYQYAKSPNDFLSKVRTFMDNLKKQLMEKHQTNLHKLLIEAGIYSSEPNELSLSGVLERCIQKVLLSPKYDLIIQTITPLFSAKDQFLEKKISELKGKDQSFFLISNSLRSQDNWAGAISELDQIKKTRLPYDKVSYLVATCRTIANIYNSGRKKQGILSADDFLPIFIYTLVNSSLTNLATLFSYIYEITPSDQLNGESGYYLTVMCSVIDFISNYEQNIKKEDAQLVIPERTTSVLTLSPASSIQFIQIEACTKIQRFYRKWLVIRNDLVLYRKIMKSHRKRTLIVQGILSTEKSYLDSLKILLQGIIQSFETSPICNEMLSSTFNEIDKIVKLHSDFISRLEDVIEKNWSPRQKIGPIFIDIAPKLLLQHDLQINNVSRNSLQLVQDLLNYENELSQLIETFDKRGNTNEI